MREILFRGKTDKGEWVQGSLVETLHWGMIINGQRQKAYGICDLHDNYKYVTQYSIGQYTGLTDKNGKKIFEGDIVKCKDYLEAKPFEFQGYIDFKNGSFVIVGDFMTHYRWLDYEVEAIGNIHDNPELLEGSAE